MKGITIRHPGKYFMAKIDLPVLLAFALFAGLIFIYLIPGFEKAMMERKRVLIHEITSSAYSLLEYYHALETEGTLEPEAAKEQARTAISNIRYGPALKDYFWVTDRHPRMIVHPYRPELNGKDLTGYRDSKGKTIFVEFVNAVSSTGESYVDYMWQWNDDSTRIVPKLSYVKLFEPWGWIIGTGLYIDDVRQEIRRLEFRALVISGLIGMIIVILLILISRQSHVMEEKRNRAEEEVKRSRELYRTLAEAASEGVLIWSAQGLQANKTMISWLGYTETELQQYNLQHVFHSPGMEIPSAPDDLYEALGARRFVEGALTAKSGKLLTAHADFSRILLGGMKAVLLVARPVKRVSAQPGWTPHPALMESIGTGFFRTTYGRKNFFIHATRPLLEMLGYNDFQELQPHPIGSFFLLPEQLRYFRSSLASREEIHKKPVLLKRKDGKAFWALVNARVDDADPKEIYCEGTIEFLSASAILSTMPMPDLHEFSAAYMMKNPVSAVMRPIVEVPDHLTVKRAVSMMQENQVEVLIITDKKGDPLGILDAKTISFNLAKGGSADTEVFRWMHSPLTLIRPDTSINEAISLLHNTLNQCLLVSSKDQSLAGMVTLRELSGAFFTAPDLLLKAVATSGSAAALKQVFLDSRKIAVSMLLGQSDPYAVSVFLSVLADAISQRVLTLCIEKVGNPPCRFAFINTGSAGRKEQTLSTDQDNAIIFEDCTGDMEASAEAYFLTLGKNINEMLAAVGYRMCLGNKMAGNPLWCQPLSRWKHYFSTWIRTPGPSELLEVSIFFDFRFCYGDIRLADELREFVSMHLQTSDIFFHHMVSAWKPFTPSVQLFSGESLDIKKLLMPLTGIIRLYALHQRISALSTPDRILELQTGKFLDHNLLLDSLKAWKVLTSMRFKHQADCITKGMEPDNTIDLQRTDRDFQSFGEQAVAAIINLMLKAGSDFYTDTI
jgi:signal-transduction protein with cAMP-binding, CBS, and nucleotidyltransferase domain/PAS domain-containing protein